ncbi:MAG: acetoin dehydrogenase dihydrolipoyllysine-residue acetyltransferase subunit [Gammaproteobacteria bacterium]|nr:acetoin dehydrogenase dihydrolipoyllysine-residue acetyltransferase subunit [Gammaproteobacteria bacterium]
MADSNITPVLMPKWGLSMEEGILTEWLIEEDVEINVGDEIMEVETDKISAAVEAADAGVLRRKVGQPGETYPVRALLGVLAPAEVSDTEIDAYIDAYVAPTDEDDDDSQAASLYAFIDTAAGRLRYAQQGDQGPCVILVHGFGGDLDNWLFNIDTLAEQCRIYALDLPGHGQSVKSIEDPGLSSLASALKAFMQAADIDSAHLVGHSMGAAVAARLACDSPEMVNSLTLIAAAGLGKEINSDYIDGFVNAESRRQLKPVLFNLFADSDLVNRNLVDELLKYKRIDGVSKVLTQLSSALFANGEQQNLLAQEIAGLDINTLVIWGKDDQVIPAEHAHNLEKAKIELVDNAGHMVQMEQASRVNELILEQILN